MYKLVNLVSISKRVFLQLAFPNNNDLPAQLSQKPNLSFVPLHIPPELLSPVLGMFLR